LKLSKLSQLYIDYEELDKQHSSTGILFGNALASSYSKSNCSFII